jgi:hypothetical protein
MFNGADVPCLPFKPRHFPKKPSRTRKGSGQIIAGNKKRGLREIVIELVKGDPAAPYAFCEAPVCGI